MKPEMIGVEFDFSGSKLTKTAISNSTHISNQMANLKLGNHVFIGHFNYIDANNAEVIIKDGVQITNYVSILTHSSHHETRIPSIRNASEEIYEKLMQIDSVYIGENSYIGPHSVIMPGTKIGKGCIISAFSYVTGEIPDFSVVRGTPGKIVGNTQDIDQKILNKYPALNEKYYLNNNAL